MMMDPKKIVLFGIAGRLGFFIKDLIFWDLFSFKWTANADISLLTGLMTGAFLSITFWNRKAVGIFPLAGALAFSGFLGFIFGFFLSFLSYTSQFISINFDFFGNSNLESGIVFGAGIYG